MVLGNISIKMGIASKEIILKTKKEEKENIIFMRVEF